MLTLLVYFFSPYFYLDIVTNCLQLKVAETNPLLVTVGGNATTVCSPIECSDDCSLPSG